MAVRIFSVTTTLRHTDHQRIRTNQAFLISETSLSIKILGACCLAK
jgi:hypothetical protein